MFACGVGHVLDVAFLGLGYSFRAFGVVGSVVFGAIVRCWTVVWAFTPVHQDVLGSGPAGVGMPWR